MADINVVADAAGYVIRCNGQQVAWCADGTRADAVADALELIEEDISGQLTQANASLDAEECRSLELERLGDVLAEAAARAASLLWGVPEREYLTEAVKAWHKGRKS